MSANHTVSGKFLKRKITSRPLKFAHFRLSAVINSTSDAVVLTSPEGIITDWNKGAGIIYGRNIDDLLGKPLWKIFPARCRSDISRMVKRIQKGEHLIEYELMQTGADIHHIDLNLAPVLDREEKIIGIIVLARDTTENKKAQEELRHSEEKYRSIIEDMLDAYFECNLDGLFTFANKSACRIIGYSLDEFLQRDYRAFTSPQTAEKIKEVFHQTFVTGIPNTLVDYEIICRDQTSRLHQLNVVLMRDAGGKPVGFRAVSRDITRRRQAEEELRQSEEKYRSILENMTEGYFESDLGGKITFVNDAGCKMLGYSRQQLYMIDSRRFTTPETRKSMDAAYRQVFQTGQTSKLDEYEIIRKDGSIRIHQLSIGLVKNGSGKKIGFRAVARDVTEKKRSEEALKQSEERIRLLFNNIPVPTIVWKAKGKTLVLAQYNDAALQYTAGRIVEWVGKTVEKCFPHAPYIAADTRHCFSQQTTLEKSFWFNFNREENNRYVTIRYAFTPPDNIIMHISDLTAQKKAEDHLKHISVHDALTGLYNRFYSDAEIARISAGRLRPVSFIVIDLNDLKSVNDRCGHAAGDLYIKNAADLLKKSFRPDDMIARIGGDEFLIILTSVDENTCGQMMKRLTDHLKDYNRHADQPISLSAGFATAYAGKAIEPVIAQADRRMYREKARMKAAQTAGATKRD